MTRAQIAAILKAYNDDPAAWYDRILGMYFHGKCNAMMQDASRVTLATIHERGDDARACGDCGGMLLTDEQHKAINNYEELQLLIQTF